MKKTIAAVLAIIFALGMVGCAANGNGQGTTETAENPLDVLNKVFHTILKVFQLIILQLVQLY